MSELVKRTLSGTVFVAVIISVLIWAPSAFGYMVAILAMLAAHEFHCLMGDKRDSVTTFLSSVAAGVLSVPVRYGFSPIELAVYSALLITALLLELWLKREDPIRNWGKILIAQVMIGLPFALMNRICDLNNLLMLAIFVIIWSNDTFAYCTGSLLSKRPGGNHKMFERVSPKKSWEGLIGGFAGALVAGYVFSLFVPEYTLCQWLILAMVIAVFGTLGDLMESLFKRTIGVKDSGRFLPGHGGILDRFDSILLATPVVYIVLQLITLL